MSKSEYLNFINNYRKRFPAEWELQDAILLALPHKQTDWVKNLEDVIDCYLKIAVEITKHQSLILLTDDKTMAKKIFSDINPDNIIIVEAPYNDTWVRDYGAITVIVDQEFHLLDFTFNGWGNKYRFEKDNLINKLVFKNNIFTEKINLTSINFILEGGAIESNGKGSLLTTSKCLLSKSRNKYLNKTEIENILKKYFGVQNILWLDYGYLKGDDTDGHIDTIARFSDENTIIYSISDNITDFHFYELQKMKNQLQSFKNELGQPFSLIPILLPDPCYNKKGKRLPATYTNFLIMNKMVLLPVYNVKQDNKALEIIQKCFPKKEIIGIDCTSLIQENGSLHCISMQYPKGILRTTHPRQSRCDGLRLS